MNQIMNDRENKLGSGGENKLKILMVSDSFPPVPSGVSKYAFHLTKELIKLGYQVDVLTGKVKERVKEDEEIEILGGKVFRVGKLISVIANGTRCFITLPTPNMLEELRRIIGNNRYDLTIMQGPLGLTLPYPVTIMLKSPKIGVFHSTTEKPNLGYILFKPIMRPFLKAVDRKIAVSRWAKWEVEKYFGPQEIEIIPPGVYTEIFSPEKGKKAENKIQILFIGRLDERKGADTLVEVWRKIKDKTGIKNGKLVPVELLIGGDGPLRKKLEKIGAEKIKFLGFISEDELPKTYASADFTVFPSKGGESFGIVLIESMSSGTPPIASNIKGYCDVVKHGKTGLLFSGEKELEKSIQTFLKDEKLREELAKNAREEAKKYDWRKIAKEIENVIRELMEQKRRYNTAH